MIFLPICCQITQIATTLSAHAVLLHLILHVVPHLLLLHNAIIPLHKHIRTALKEQHAKDEFLKFGGVHLAAQEVDRSK